VENAPTKEFAAAGESWDNRVFPKKYVFELPDAVIVLVCSVRAVKLIYF
jgi:hypothetical protein